jgi:PAS domain S-box-containing protein
MRCDKGTILDAMEHVSAAAIVDARGIVTGWSEGARRLTGYPAEEAVGRAVGALLAQRPLPEAVAALHGIAVIRHRDGSSVPLAVRAHAVLGENGEPHGYALTAEPPAHPPAEPEPALAEQAFQQASMSMSVFDTQQRYLRLNDVACRVMGVSEEALLGRFFPDSVEDAEHSRGFLSNLRQVVETGRPVRYESFTGAPALNREHAWSIEMWPLRDPSGELTAVALAAFDSTEQYLARQRLALLNRAASAIGTTLDVVRTAEELVELLVPRYADFASVDLLEWVLGADEPPPAPDGGIVLRRVAHGSATEGTPEAAVHLGATDVYPPFSPPARALSEGRAVVSQAGEPEFVRWVAERNARAPEGRPYRTGVHSMLAVPLRARGTTLGVAVGVRMAHPDDYAADDAVLAEELASRAAVCIDNARRFARERSTALALQHSLLPRGLPGQAVVEVAHRYLPSGSLAGIGGDWFDVIPLSGSRVALVVGDVVGHVPLVGDHGPSVHGRPHPRRRRSAARRAPHPPRRPGHPPCRGRRRRRGRGARRHLPLRRLRPRHTPPHPGRRRASAAGRRPARRDHEPRAHDRGTAARRRRSALRGGGA